MKDNKRRNIPIYSLEEIKKEIDVSLEQSAQHSIDRSLSAIAMILYNWECDKNPKK